MEPHRQSQQHQQRSCRRRHHNFVQHNLLLSWPVIMGPGPSTDFKANGRSADMVERGRSGIMTRASAFERQQEVFRYLTGSFGQNLHDDEQAQSSCDPALTAFAQLGALRLNAAHCIISLVGDKREYVLAEAGRTLSLQDDHRYDAGDDLLLGRGEMGTRGGVGHILTDILAETPQPLLPHVLIEDLQQDERFNHLLMVTEPPYLRSLVCLPLRTPRNHVIGLYCIVDDKPRNAVDDIELQVLRDMAATTMKHIEAARIKQQNHRCEKVIKALALFLSVSNSLRSWGLNQSSEGGNVQRCRTTEQTRPSTPEEQSNQVFCVPEGPDRVSRTTIDNLRDSLNFQRDDQSVRPKNREKNKLLAYNTVLTPRPRVTIPQSISSKSVNLNTKGTSVASDTTLPRLSSLSSQGIKHLPEEELRASLSAELETIFNRASHLLREAIDLDGVAFFDTRTGSFDAGYLWTGMNQKNPGVHTLDTTSGTSTSGSDGGLKQGPGERELETSSSPAGVMGYSTRSRLSLKALTDSQKLGSFPYKLLRILAKRHPHGKVFNFEDDGSVSSGDFENQVSESEYSNERPSSAQSRKGKKHMSQQVEAAAIHKIIPDARSVGWFPLWDAMNERWYAGALIWTSSPFRVLRREDEITYMATWGDSIMAEVYRLTALEAYRVKADLVSSITHDVRSPLQGILATVELLQEAANLSPLQADMIGTISSCGKKILDTIKPHLLEFAKYTGVPER